MKKYEQVYFDLQAAIANRVYLPGQRLPSEQELCAQYQVSKTSVIKALKMLEFEQKITRVQGGGSFVTKSMRQKRVLFSESNRETSHSAQARGQETNQLLAIVPQRLALFGEEDDCFCISRSKSLDGQLYAVQNNFVHAHFFNQGNVGYFAAPQSVAAFWWDIHHLDIFSLPFEEKITFTPNIPTDIRDRLQLRPDEPVIKFEKITFLRGKPIEFVETYMNYRYYQIELKSE